MKKNKFLPGFLAGAVNGLIGGGGGLLLVPLLKRMGGLPAKRAHATAVATMACLSAVSLVIYLWSGAVDMSIALPLCIGGAAGGACGALWLRRVPVKMLRTGFALFMIWSAWRLWFG
ncbi:MAG TPA: TSUP family transporter [Terriglobales bacterium]|nr:TSUP family transporter [Terriglobales bacterium]